MKEKQHDKKKIQVQFLNHKLEIVLNEQSETGPEMRTEFGVKDKYLRITSEWRL